MSCCHHCRDAESMFDRRDAEQRLGRYRRRGLEGTTRLLVEALREAGVRGATVLDVGGGVGVVHHIAFRAPNDEAQLALRRSIVEAGYDVTPVLDRQYFHSIYFREPGGVICEVATDSPGFAIDESVAELGSHLKLPPWLESRRDRIEAGLPPLNVPPSNHS